MFMLSVIISHSRSASLTIECFPCNMLWEWLSQRPPNQAFRTSLIKKWLGNAKRWTITMIEQEILQISKRGDCIIGKNYAQHNIYLTSSAKMYGLFRCFMLNILCMSHMHAEDHANNWMYSMIIEFIPLQCTIRFMHAIAITHTSATYSFQQIYEPTPVLQKYYI